MNLSTILKNVLCALMLLCGLRLDAAANPASLPNIIRKIGIITQIGLGDTPPSDVVISSVDDLRTMAQELPSELFNNSDMIRFFLQAPADKAGFMKYMEKTKNDLLKNSQKPTSSSQSFREQAETTKQQLMSSTSRPAKPAPTNTSSSGSLAQMIRNIGAAGAAIKLDIQSAAELKEIGTTLKSRAEVGSENGTLESLKDSLGVIRDFTLKPMRRSPSSGSRSTPGSSSSSSSSQPTVYLNDDSKLDPYQKQLNELYKSWAVWLNDKVDGIFFSSYVMGLNGIYKVKDSLDANITRWIESLYIKQGYGIDNLTQIIAYEMCNDPRNLKLTEAAFKQEVIKNITSYLDKTWQRDDLSNSMNNIFGSFCIGSKLSDNEESLVTEIANVTDLGNINLLYGNYKDQIESYWNLPAIQTLINQELPKTILDICKKRITWGIAAKRYRIITGRKELAEKLLDIIFAELYQRRGIALNRTSLIDTVRDIIYAVGSRGKTLDEALAESDCNRICKPSARGLGGSSSSTLSSSSGGFSDFGGFGSSSSPSSSSSSTNRADEVLKNLTDSTKFTRAEIDTIANDPTIKTALEEELITCSDFVKGLHVQSGIMNEVKNGPRAQSPSQSQFLQRFAGAVGQRVINKTYNGSEPIGSLYGAWLRLSADAVRQVFYLLTQGIPFEDAINTAGPK